MSARDPTRPSQPLDHRSNHYFVSIIDFMIIPEVGRGLEPSRRGGRAQLPLHKAVVLSHIGMQTCRGEATAVVSATQSQRIKEYTNEVSFEIFSVSNDTLANYAFKFT